MANEEQLAILRQGFEVWNQWRRKNPEVKVNLSGALLVEKDLRRVDLSRANLSGAYLSRAYLKMADLREADLSKANLNRTNFIEANLSRANLRGADLRKAYLGGADLTGADFRKANLSGAYLSGARLSGADLTGADFTGVDLMGVDLSEDQRRQIEEDLLRRKENEKHPEREKVEKEYKQVKRPRPEKNNISIGGNVKDSTIVVGSNNQVAFENVHKPENVFFTAYHPKEGRVEAWQTLLVYAHVSSALAKVREDTKRFHDQIKVPKETTSKSATSIARGTKLTIIPSCKGVTFNPKRLSFKWIEDFHRADFRFKAGQSLSGDAAKGQITIYVGPLIIGTLKFAMLFNEKNAQLVPDHEEHAKMYGRDDVFISYSRKDSEVARTFKTVLEGTGLDVFLDVDDIRSGQLWEDELKRRIEQAQIFQIFWSANYSQSENCRQEWQYALKQNKDEGYIRPVYWHKPLSPNPPEELNKFNFKYVELKIPNVE